MRKVAAVVGVGVGIGGEVAKALAAAGYDVGLFSRNKSYKGADKLSPLVREIGAERAWGIVMDAADQGSVRSGFAELRQLSGGRGVSVLVYNAGARRMGDTAVEAQDAQELLDFWRVNAFGAFLCVQQVWGDMTAAGSGTILLTGATASLRGAAGMAAFGMGKAGLRSLAQTLAAEGAPLGVHVCHVVVDAPVDIPLLRKVTGRGPEQLADPREIGRLYALLAAQPPTCWTSELDVHIRAKL